MPLAAGTRLGSYEVVSAIGSGGMGEVYRARDTKLGREVAIKILPDAFAADADRLARFEREARTLATLNHASIAQIYGVEGNALIMELVDGEDLAARLARGPIPVGEAMALARQVAAAIEAAHDAGVIHRDLKPANIKLRSDGTVKVLDFGLAKLEARALADASSADRDGTGSSRALTSPPATRDGLIVGTPAYMSPEQARGNPVDKRTDVWAFGVVFYEMLTGRALFAAANPSDSLAAVLRADVSLADLPRETPPVVHHLLARCLERDARRRLRDIGEARVLLEELPSHAPPAEPSSARPLLPWIVSAALAIALVIVAVTAWLTRAQPASAMLTASIPLPPGTTFALAGGSPGPLTISPDGGRIALALVQKGQTMLWLRDLDAPTFRSLPGTEGAEYPFWSPDGQSIGFFADERLKVVDISGGLPRAVADVPDGKGGAWNADGSIIFTPTAAAGLSHIASRGGAASALTTLARDIGENSHRFPFFFADGRHFLFLARGTSDANAARYGGSIRVASLGGDVNRVLTVTGSHAAFASGHVLYVQPGTSTLVARPFDTRALDWRGDPVKIAEDVLVLDTGMRGVFDASQNGVLAYLARAMRPQQELVWVTRSGQRSAALTDLRDYAFALSPDGQRVAFQELGTSSAEDLWTIDTERGVRTRITRSPVPEGHPVWSPAGHAIAYTTGVEGEERIHWTSLERPSDDVVLHTDAEPVVVTDWSRDGRYLLFNAIASEGGIWALPLTSSSPPRAGTPQRVVTTPGVSRGSAFSPDGRWVAYASRESGAYQIFVTQFPDARGTKQVSITGGGHPRWRADGKELYFATPTGGIMAVPIDSRATGDLALGTPVLLFETGRPLDDYPPFDVNADGSRFLVMAPRESPGTAMMTLIMNWTHLVTRP
jgi:Tol biopolymer transport system component